MAGPHYTAVATSTGDGRNGTVTSADGRLELIMALPSELGGSGEGTNPEQLFAAGWSACFHSALKRVASDRKVTLQDSAVVAEVSLVPTDGGFTLAAALHIELGGLDQATADELVDAAHQVCPYSNATRGNIEVSVDATVA